MMNRYKPVGWRNEPHRHYLAAKGIKTKYDYLSGKGIASGIYAAKENNDMVSFSPMEAKSFKKRYEAAVANGEEQFTWNGRPVLTSYAKYMVEYMGDRGYLAKKEYIVRNNETGQTRSFKTMDEAQKFQEHLVFDLGVDAEVQ